MKKTIILTSIVALATISCTKNETISAAQEAISLKTYTYGATKVAEATNASLQASGFTLYAYRTSTDATVSGNFGTIVLPSPYINGKAVTYASTTWSVASGPYYWPATNKLQFFGVNYPGAWTPPTTGSAWPKFAYTVKAVAAQEDLMACNTINRLAEGPPATAVNMVFKHLLTQVYFSWTGDVNTGNLLTYKINSISIKTVKDAATFTFNGTGQIDETVKLVPGVWSAATGTATYAYNLTGVTTQATVSTATPNSLRIASNPLMLMPQALAGSSIDVDYTVTDAASNVIFTGVKNVALTGTWAAGSKINYVLALPAGGEPITFNPTVTNWNAETQITVNP